MVRVPLADIFRKLVKDFRFEAPVILVHCFQNVMTKKR